MPAVRSHNNDKGKAKAPSLITRPKKIQNEKVDPCAVCGIVVSRKGDVARHAKTHAIGDAEKLFCKWEGCKFATLQKSNLKTHYRRHTLEKPFCCNDDPECDFRSGDPALLLRHRKKRHGYIPKCVRRRNEKPRVIRGVEADLPGYDIEASHSLTFSSAEGSASESGSSSSQPFSAEASRSSSSQPPSLPFLYSLSSPFPTTSGSYPHQSPHSLSLFDTPHNGYVYVDLNCPFTSEVLDGPSESSCQSEFFAYPGQYSGLSLRPCTTHDFCHHSSLLFPDPFAMMISLDVINQDQNEYNTGSNIMSSYYGFANMSVPVDQNDMDVVFNLPSW